MFERIGDGLVAAYIFSLIISAIVGWAVIEVLIYLFSFVDISIR